MRTVVVGLGAVFLANLDASAFTLAVPLLHHAFPAEPAGRLSLVQTGYGLGFAALILPAGHLADRRGPRAPLLAGLCVFTAASVAGSAAGAPWLVYLARVLSGAGIATAVPAALSLMLSGAEPALRRKRAGQWGAAGAVAAGCGPVLGGVLGQFTGWRGLFLLTAVPAIVMVVIALRGEMGAQVASGGTGAAQASPGGYGGPGKPPMRRGGLGGIAPPVVILAGVAVGAGVYGLQVMTGLALVDGAHLSVIAAGLLLAPASLLAAVASLRVGRLRRARSTGIACALGGVALLGGCGIVVMGGRTATVAGAALGLVGLGVAATCVSTAAVLAAGPAVGRVTAISQVARQAGGAAGAAVVGAAIDLALNDGWLVLACLAAAIAVLGGLLARPPGRIPA
jgi:predicted MFS family arabinose efflux permease